MKIPTYSKKQKNSTKNFWKKNSTKYKSESFLLVCRGNQLFRVKQPAFFINTYAIPP